MPYELLAPTSARSRSHRARHGLLTWKRWLEMLVNHMMVFQFCRPIWDLWVRYALMMGVLDGSVEDYRSVRWVAPPVEMLDAGAEVMAVVERVRKGFMSRTEAMTQTGMDAEQVEAEIAAENRRADALGSGSRFRSAPDERARSRATERCGRCAAARNYRRRKRCSYSVKSATRMYSVFCTQVFTRDAVLELSERAAELAPSSFNAERYTVDVIFSSGAAVERSDLQGRFLEVLEMTSAAADLSEFVGAPVLDAHNRTSSRSIYGTVARRGSIAGAASPRFN